MVLSREKYFTMPLFRRQKKMRLNTASSVMFIASKGKTVFKFLNDK